MRRDQDPAIGCLPVQVQPRLEAVLLQDPGQVESRLNMNLGGSRAISLMPSPSQRLVALYVILNHRLQCCDVSILRREVYRLPRQMRTQ